MDNNLNEIFTKAKDLLKDEMTSISHDTWIKPLDIVSITDNKIVLFCPDSFIKSTIDTKFHDLILNTFSFLLQKNCELSIICEDSKGEDNIK